MDDRYTSTNILSVEEALEQTLAVAHVLESERVGMLEARGRVLAEDIVSDIDISPFDNSAMDGFAIRAVDSAGASLENPVSLSIVGAIGAGNVFNGTVGHGEALRIMTGAPVPDGADTVVKIESVTVEGASEDNPLGTKVLLVKEQKLGNNVRPKGEEAKAGQTLLKAGTVVHDAGVGLLAATGNIEVAVYRRPRVAILSSGDELVDPTVKPGPGQIRNSNCYSLAAAVQSIGAEATILGIVPDDYEVIRDTIKEAAASYDMVLISGGAAEGDFDYSYKVMCELGEVFFNKVNMRPGKAQTLSIIDGAIVFGLAGNPSAAMVGFEVLLRPALRLMQGYSKLKRPITRARLTVDTPKPDNRRAFIRGRLEYDIVNNVFSVTPSGNQSSALLSALQASNCLIVLPEGDVGYAAGDTVACFRLDVGEGVVV